MDMPDKLLIDTLYKEMLLLGLILLVIMYHNTLILCKRKWNDLISAMLLSTICMSSFELLWTQFEGNRDMYVLTYIGACGYAISFLVWGAFFSHFFLKQYGLTVKNAKLRWLLYGAPVGIFVFFCITTPLTGLVFSMDENGYTNEGILFQTYFYFFLFVDVLAALIPSFHYATSKKYKGQTVSKIAKDLIIFSVIAPFIYLMQVFLLGVNSDYLALSLACSISLVYLINNVNTRLMLESQAKMDLVTNDLKVAAKIQSDALPPVAPEFKDHPGLNLRASMNTAREVGGDFYDYFPIDDHRICILIADVSGKGTPAALFMMTAKTTIKDYAMLCSSTSEIFTTVNKRLCENNVQSMFATAWIGILDTDTMTMQFTNAGHNYPYILHADGTSEFIKKGHGLFLAGFDDTEYGQTEFEMHDGDRLFLYTDGVTEANNSAKELYGDDRLAGMLKQTYSLTGEEVLKTVFKDIQDFASGEPQFDDITMMVLTVKK